MPLKYATIPCREASQLLRQMSDHTRTTILMALLEADQAFERLNATVDIGEFDLYVHLKEMVEAGLILKTDSSHGTIYSLKGSQAHPILASLKQATRQQTATQLKRELTP